MYAYTTSLEPEGCTLQKIESFYIQALLQILHLHGDRVLVTVCMKGQCWYSISQITGETGVPTKQPPCRSVSFLFAWVGQARILNEVFFNVKSKWIRVGDGMDVAKGLPTVNAIT